METMSDIVVPETQFFRDVFNASPIGIAVENMDGQPLFANPALCSMLGLTEEEMRNKHCVQFSPPEDANRDWDLFQQLRSGSIDHYQIEKRYFRRDGSLFWGSLSVSLLKTQPLPLVVAMVEDITEKKLAQESQRKHSAIVESSDDAIASVTVAGIIESWNAGAQRMFGYTEAEAVGKPITMIVPPELPEEEDWILNALRAGRRIEDFETVRITKAGKRINVSLRISPIKDSTGKIVGISGITRDITSRKRAEARLREYEKAVEGVDEMIAVVDRDYRYLIANRKFLNARNMSKEQVEGRTAKDVLNHGVFEAVVKEKLDQCFQGQIVRFEMKYSYPDRGERDVLVSYFPIEGPGGIDRVACIIQDITDRKATERVLAGMNRKLIEAQEQERARIAKELHDDINQRLALLAVEVETIRQSPPDSADNVGRLLHEVKERISEISSEVQSISHRLYSSQLQYLGLVPAMRGFCRELSERQKVEISFTHNDVPVTISHEVSLCLFRILQEALHNATKHSQVRHYDARLIFSSNQLQLTVSDRGVGFDTSTAMNNGGIGLISMRERVQSVSGTIAIDSQPLGGTTIRACVPLSSEEVSEQAVG